MKFLKLWATFKDCLVAGITTTFIENGRPGPDQKKKTTKKETQPIANWFERAFERVILFEGGYADDPYDSGGKTMYGITEAVADRYGYEGEMKNLPIETAKDIYRNNYWHANGCGDFDNFIIAELVFDMGVNMGNRVAVRKLQKAYNLLSNNEITVDGLIGPETLGAVNGYPHTRDLAFWYCTLRSLRYKNIVAHNKTQRRFIRGWGRRVQSLLEDVLTI